MDKEEKYRKIVFENEERLQKMCRYYVDNGEDRKDLLQEILTNIWKSLDNYKGASEMNTYIYRVAINTCLTFRSKLFKEQKRNLNWDPSLLDSMELYDGAIDTKLREDQLVSIETELNALSIIDKSLITLMLEGLSMKDISSVIGITEPNVKTKIHRIKSYLKTKLTAS